MKFVFSVSDYNLGGISSSLKNLTDELIFQGHEVAILNISEEKRPAWINDKITFIELTGRAKKWSFSFASFKRARIYKKPFLLFLGLIKKIMVRLDLWLPYAFKNFYVSERFDYAIAFRQEPTSIYLAKNKINCGLKVSFWHSDPDAEAVPWDKCLKGLDVIACVSNSVRDKMAKKYPDIKMKTVYNVFDAERIKTLSKEFNANYEEKFNIVTVARIEFSQKQQNFIPQIASKLKKDGLSFCWYVVGDGVHKTALEQLILENKVEDCVKLVGSKQNPYPYVRQADLFVLTSSWESYGMVVVESLILSTPVVAGFYSALPEILEDKKYGLISTNSVDGIYLDVKKLIENKELYNQLKENCNAYVYDKKPAYKQFMDLKND